MPSSTTDIVNLALTKLGAKPVLSLNDDTNEGRVMSRLFLQVRDAELRRHRWNFAIKRAQLVALSSAPSFGYRYQYQAPNDMLYLLQVGTWYSYDRFAQQGLWSLESNDDGGEVILTDLQAPLPIRYVKRLDNSGYFDALFVEALACKLAFEACEALTQSGQKKQLLDAQYRGAVSEAARVDALENPPDQLPRGSWLEARDEVAVLFEAFQSGYIPPAPTPGPSPAPGPSPSNEVYADAYATGYTGT